MQGVLRSCDGFLRQQQAHFTWSVLSSLTSWRKFASQPKPGQQWQYLKDQGHPVNPCNSLLHPAVVEGGLQPDDTVQLSVQEAYTPESTCFGCGPSNDAGLKLQSFRVEGGLQANTRLHKKFQAFPGIINGGIVSTLFDCHGNWTAAIALMDRSTLPRPPLTLTYELLVTYKEPTPPEQDLVLRSKVVTVVDAVKVGGAKTTVQVDLTLHKVSPGGQETLCAQGTGIFKKLGALRAL